MAPALGPRPPHCCPKGPPAGRASVMVVTSIQLLSPPPPRCLTSDLGLSDKIQEPCAIWISDHTKFPYKQVPVLCPLL